METVILTMEVNIVAGHQSSLEGGMEKMDGARRYLAPAALLITSTSSGAMPQIEQLTPTMFLLRRHWPTLMATSRSSLPTPKRTPRTGAAPTESSPTATRT